MAVTALAGTGDPGEGGGFAVIGKIRHRSALEIEASNWSIGCEALDRDFAVYANYRQYLGPLGAKRARVQAGWAKTEKEKGAYRWDWLDEIVSDMVAQGVRPWLQTSYGNLIYEGGGGIGLGDEIPKSPEALAAWDAWVQALVRRYKDRVTEWEVWNEPDLGGAVPPEDYAGLFIRTAQIIRREQPDAYIDALALAGNTTYAERFLRCLQQQDKLHLVSAITIHGYPQNPDNLGNIDKLRSIVARFSASIDVRQGETGAPSAPATVGALAGPSWTELTQAKWDLRRMLAHLGRDVPFSLFSIVDMHYKGRMNGINSKGLLRTNPDKTVAGPKPAYSVVQNVTAIFDNSVERVPDYPCTASVTNKMAFYAYRKKSSGSQILTMWFNGNVPHDSNATTPVTLTLPAGKFSEPVYADLRTGLVSAIPSANVSNDGGAVVFRDIPVYDSPVLIAEKSAIPIVPIDASE